MDIKDLTPEQKAKALACTTSEELAALAKEFGVKLTDEQLDAISGGSWNDCDQYYEDPYCEEDCSPYLFW